jgi:hypothetical protein
MQKVYLNIYQMKQEVRIFTKYKNRLVITIKLENLFEIFQKYCVGNMYKKH